MKGGASKRARALAALAFLVFATLVAGCRGECRRGPGPDVDWRRCNKVGADLRGADLRGATLSEADLTKANLSGAVLS